MATAGTESAAIHNQAEGDHPMTRFAVIAALFLSLGLQAKPAPVKWKFAGESQGVVFYLRMDNACKPEGSQVFLKLENTLNHPVTVSFRLSDSDWNKTFTRELAAGATDTRLRYRPDDGPACYPFIDQIHLGEEGTQVTQTGEE